jgi:NAD+ kinase
VLPISSKGQPDFFFDVTTTNFESTVNDLLDGKWTSEKKTRLCASVGGKDSPPLLNDVAVFARRSATLIRYSLFLDGERFWKDGSDGLIIATPTGSTAYSLSVGGPVVLTPAPVISVIPVNSVNPARRPLVVSDEVTIEIRDLSSSVTIEMVLDGQLRRKVDGGPVNIRRAENDAVFVKFTEERLADLRGKLIQKTEVFGDLAQDLPPSAKLVLKVLEYQGRLTQKEIIEETMLPARTVRYALSLLISEGLIRKHVSLRDSRQGVYNVTKKKAGRNGHTDRQL